MRLAISAIVFAFFEIRKINESHRVNADVIVDDKFEPRQTNAVVRVYRSGKGIVGVADVHHHFCIRAFFVGDISFINGEINLAVIDIAAFAFRARNRYVRAGFQNFRVALPVPTMQGSPSSRLIIAL